MRISYISTGFGNLNLLEMMSYKRPSAKQDRRFGHKVHPDLNNSGIRNSQVGFFLWESRHLKWATNQGPITSSSLEVRGYARVAKLTTLKISTPN